MSQNGRPGNILSFFKPVARPQTPLVQTQPNSGSQNSRPRSPSPLPPSSPPSHGHTPVKSKTAVRRDLEIMASDDDDFGASSDDSFEDLSTILGRGRPSLAEPSPTKRSQHLLRTPKAKRTAVEFHSSPLAIISKHKFDLKALAKDARKDDASHASSLKHKAATDLSSGGDEETTASEATRNPFEKVVKEKDAQKVLRAVQRTEGGHSALRYCFFQQDYEAPCSTIPMSANKNLWQLLTQGDICTREQNIVSGLPMTLLKMRGCLPDELFDWILEELCVTKSSLLRHEYCNLIHQCGHQVERTLIPTRLEDLFLLLGACEEIEQRQSSLILSKPDEEPYKNQDWGNLRSFLILLRLIAPWLAVYSVAYAIETLLKMSIDKFLVYNIDLLVEYETAIQALLEAIPRPSWDMFCHQTSSLFCKIIKPQSLRTNMLACLPMSKAEGHDLRRRLAVAFLFDDPDLGRYRPDDAITIKGVIERLKESDFSVGPKTDFAELRAGIILLNIAIDDGSFLATGEPEDEKEFNNDIDELTTCLREIWRKINDAGMKLARTETKSVIEWVQQRISHSVRTKKKAKKSIFDLPGQKEDALIPRQQEYMKSFFKKTQPKPKPEPEPELKLEPVPQPKPGPQVKLEPQPEPQLPPVLIDEDTIVVKVK